MASTGSLGKLPTASSLRSCLTDFPQVWVLFAKLVAQSTPQLIRETLAEILIRMYYKFRDFKNYKYILDIILNQRLYSSSFKNLNDNFEGQFFSEMHGKRIRLNPLKEKHLSVCSFSNYYKNPLLWSHYADGQRGFAIGFIISKEKYEIQEVNYNGLCKFKEFPYSLSDKKNIFLNKIEDWHYEKESRIITETQCYINIEIKEIIFGAEVSDIDKELINKLIGFINPKIKILTYYD